MKRENLFKKLFVGFCPKHITINNAFQRNLFDLLRARDTQWLLFYGYSKARHGKFNTFLSQILDIYLALGKASVF